MLKMPEACGEDSFARRRFAYGWFACVALLGMRLHRTRATGDCERQRLDKSIYAHSERKIVTMIIDSLDSVPTNFLDNPPSTEQFIVEDHSSVIQKNKQGRALTLRHVTRIHSVDLDWLIERVGTHHSSPHCDGYCLCNCGRFGKPDKVCVTRSTSLKALSCTGFAVPRLKAPMVTDADVTN